MPMNVTAVLFLENQGAVNAVLKSTERISHDLDVS